MGLIPEEFISDLLHRADIVEIIREYVPLKKQGQNYVGLCPFHSEKTPSFVVSPHKQIYHCFGCGKGGNAFSFMMEKNGGNFVDAVHAVAKRYGVNVPQTEKSPEKAKQDKLRDRYFKINELAARFYRNALHGSSGQDALAYIKKRDLNTETQENFMLGYAPAGWNNLSKFLLDKGVSQHDLILLGLSIISQRGTLVDRFRNRLMFPIADDRGRIIGFGGRVLDDSQPKYLNSPETPLFYKGKHLYGLNLAKASIRKRDQLIIMEGYMDVIMAHQHGITNCIGSLGTALTANQARLMMRYTYNTSICFDADAAGQKAALRGLDILEQCGCRLSVITIPQGKDPDEYIRKQGKDAFEELIVKAKPFLEYKLLRLMEKYNPDTVEGKIQVIEKLLPDMQKITSPLARQAFVQVIAEKLVFPETAIYAELRKFSGVNRNNKQDREVKRKCTSIHALEKAQRALLKLVLEYPEVISKVEAWGGKELFNHTLLKEIYQNNYLMRQAGHNIKANDLVTLLDNPDSQRLLTEILIEEDSPGDVKRIFNDCLINLRLDYINNKIIEKSSLMSKYEESGDVTKSLEIMSQIQQLVKEKQSLATTLRKGGILNEN